MAGSQFAQAVGQVMLASLMSQVQNPDSGLMILAQGFAQHPVERGQAGAGGHQPERALLPVGIVVQGTAAQLAQTQGLARLKMPGGVAKGPTQPTVQME